MKKIDHFRSWSPDTKMVVIFGILDPENPQNQPKTKFSPQLKIDPETLKGVVDKILEPVANFRCHFRTQWGRFPRKISKSYHFK